MSAKRFRGPIAVALVALAVAAIVRGEKDMKGNPMQESDVLITFYGTLDGEMSSAVEIKISKDGNWLIQYKRRQPRRLARGTLNQGDLSKLNTTIVSWNQSIKGIENGWAEPKFGGCTDPIKMWSYAGPDTSFHFERHRYLTGWRARTKELFDFKSRRRQKLLERIREDLIGLIPELGEHAPFTTSAAMRGPDIKPTAITSMSDANNQLALDLYGQFRSEENVFLSPYSLLSALAMTYEGARTGTAEEMRTSLHFPVDRQTMRSQWRDIDSRLQAPGAAYVLKTANALWAEKAFAFQKTYLDIVEQNYRGYAANLDFRGDPEQARQAINRWVASNTNGRIKDLIPAKKITSMTRLVLTNTVYFKAAWALPFKQVDTRDDIFRVTSGEVVHVPMMRGFYGYISYAETADVQILELPYGGDNLSALFVLPKSESLEALEKTLTLESLSQWRASLRSAEVEVHLPKFKLNEKYEMGQALSRLGMREAFSPPADFGGTVDFSGMTGRKDMSIGAVIHQTFVELNEEGTEAAAATAVLMPEGAAPPSGRRAVFRADHPFLFLIQDSSTGLILFLGKVSRP